MNLLGFRLGGAKKIFCPGRKLSSLRHCYSVPNYHKFAIETSFRSHHAVNTRAIKTRPEVRERFGL